MPTRTNALKPGRWTVLAAWGAFLVTVPSAVWRVLMIVGLMPGTKDLRQFELAGDASLAYGYVATLSIVQLTAGFLTVGLIRPWGERFLGRRVPLVPVLVVATLGGLAVVWLFDISMVGALVTGRRPDAGLVSGVPLAVMVACYAPILLWGPLELLATAGYGLRRRRHARLGPPNHDQQILPTEDKQTAVGHSEPFSTLAHRSHDGRAKQRAG
jgi:hypothetical protein